MFIGRDKELETLEKCYLSNKFEFIVMYGRRRVGKTALISKFIEDKSAIYIMGIESNEEQNLANLSQSIFEFELGKEVKSQFHNFQEALNYIFELSLEKRVILAIDEYPYIAKSDMSLSSVLQGLIDKYRNDSKLMLILCGSSMSFMEQEVLAYKAPLHGRRTAQMKLNPFEYKEVIKYFKNVSPLDSAYYYGIVGGTPQYLIQVNQNLSIKENLIENVLNPNAFLYSEPENLLKQEMREVAMYNAILTAIANGSSRVSEIASKVGESTAMVSTYLRNLIALQLVSKAVPYGEKQGKKTIYRLNDPLFQFWFRFIPQLTSLISRGASEQAYQYIAPHLDQYMGYIFEKICTEYLWQRLLQNDLSFTFLDLASWWGNNPQTKKQEEIDIMGTSGHAAVFGECKWKNERVGTQVLDQLIERSQMFPYVENHYFLFSKTGFTPACQERAEQLGNVELVTFADIYTYLSKI